MKLRMKNFNITGVRRKIWFLGGVRGIEKPIYRRELSEKGGLALFANLGGGGGLGKKEGDFEGGWYPNAHYVHSHTLRRRVQNLTWSALKQKLEAKNR